MDQFLIVYMSNFVNGSVNCADFVEHFENWWNFEADRGAFEPDERLVLQELFEKVIYFSPFADELASIKHYVDDQAIRDAATIALRVLSTKKQ